MLVDEQDAEKHLVDAFPDAVHRHVQLCCLNICLCLQYVFVGSDDATVIDGLVHHHMGIILVFRKSLIVDAELTHIDGQLGHLALIGGPSVDAHLWQPTFGRILQSEVAALFN